MIELPEKVYPTYLLLVLLITQKLNPYLSNMPNYKNIYTNLIRKKFPDREDILELMNKKTLTSLDIIQIDRQLHSPSEIKDVYSINQKFRSYDKNAILQILDHQKKHNYTNTLVAKEFGLSRNTIGKWKKIFLV